MAASRPATLIFPNIEMRLALGMVKGRWVNLHLLVSPEDPDHLIELKRFLGRLSFRAFEDSFNCSRDDLIKLGQKVDPSLIGDAALALGSTQFKVNFEQTFPATAETENAASYQGGAWLPFLNTYRTMCLAPQPDFRRVLENVQAMQLAA
jgi:hypothetical protein